MKQKFAYYLKGGRGRNHARTESKSKKEEIFDRILITLLFVSAAVFLLPANRLIVELWHSLALQLMVSYWLFALASMAFKKWNLSLAAAGASLVCMFIIDTGTIDNRAVSPVTSVVMEHAEGVRIKGTQLKVAHFNVLKPNRDFERTLKAVESSEADLISFQEVDDAWMQVLTS